WIGKRRAAMASLVFRLLSQADRKSSALNLTKFWPDSCELRARSPNVLQAICRSILSVLSQVHGVGFAAVDISRGIGRDAFGGCAAKQNFKSRIAGRGGCYGFRRRFLRCPGRRDQACSRSISAFADPTPPW